jgi:hypothetical protein
VVNINGYDDGERMGLVIPFIGSGGTRYEAGWTGTHDGSVKVDFSHGEAL